MLPSWVLPMGRNWILLVEDDPDDAALAISAIAGGSGPEVILKKDGAEALAFLFDADRGTNTQMPRLILLDLKLPKIDGFEVLRCLRADSRTQRIPVVVLTSSDEHDDVCRCYACGANSYVCKPVDAARFTEVLRTTRDYWIGVNVSATRE